MLISLKATLKKILPSILPHPFHCFSLPLPASSPCPPSSIPFPTHSLFLPLLPFPSSPSSSSFSVPICSPYLPSHSPFSLSIPIFPPYLPSPSPSSLPIFPLLPDLPSLSSLPIFPLLPHLPSPSPSSLSFPISPSLSSLSFPIFPLFPHLSLPIFSLSPYLALPIFPLPPHLVPPYLPSPSPSSLPIPPTCFIAVSLFSNHFLQSQDSLLCERILESILRIYTSDHVNYFILEPQRTISTFIEKVYEKEALIQEKVFKLLEFVACNLNWTPSPELISLSILFKNTK